MHDVHRLNRALCEKLEANWSQRLHRFGEELKLSHG